MSRLMSVAFTERAVVERRKTVTRRKGWLMLKPGDRLTLCRKVMGRKPDEPLVRLGDVEVVSVRREPLCAVMGPYEIDPLGHTIWPELIAEGFHDLTPDEFRRFYFQPQGLDWMDDVTRIEWRYLCPAGDPACPCQDGDACHYVADVDTPAMATPSKEA